MSFRSYCLVFLGALLLIVSPLSKAKYTSDQVKAVYLFRIASFVYWPQEEHKSQINICVPDNFEIQSILKKITLNKTVREKPFSVTSRDCDLLYISDESHLSMMEQQPSTTVFIGDITKFALRGGVIELTLNNGRIKPKVNMNNIGDYSISSNFLRIADVVGESK